jgi:hypothetical protein
MIGSHTSSAFAVHLFDKAFKQPVGLVSEEGG